MTFATHRGALRSLRRSLLEPSTDDESAELERLRQGEQDMDTVVRQRERLRIELADCRATAMTSCEPPTVDVVGVTPVAAAPANDSERERLAAVVAQQEATIGDLRARIWNHEAKIGELQSVLTAHHVSTAPRDPDLEDGARVLGEKVRLNDLTMVEGIGPRIADLLRVTGGITTWWELHRTDVATLRTLLDGAGPLFRVHDPSSWPPQAGLLARGEWEGFKTMAMELKVGRVSR